jgi:hypothetical protein
MNKIPGIAVIIFRIVGALFAVLFIGYLNWLVIQGWFGGQGPANLGSIEVSYVSMGRFLSDFGFRSWAPFWYLGFPFHLFYTPLLPALEWFLNGYQGMGFWEAYRFVSGWSYVMAPISVFFLGWALSRRWVGGFISGVLYSVAPTLFYFVLPASTGSIRGEVAADRFSLDFWDPRRFTVMVRWGEGPHTLSLAFLPLVGAFFILGLKRKSFWLVVLSSIFLALTALSNALGFMGALIMVGSIAFVYYARKTKNRGRLAATTALLLVFGIGLASFWYNLSFLTNFFGEGGGIAQKYLSLFPWGWLAIIFALAIVYIASRTILRDTGLAASLVWFSGLFGVVFVYYTSAPQQFSELRLELLPQALRYITQVDMAFSVLIGTFIAWLIRLMGKRFRLGEIIATVFIAVSLLYSIVYIKPFASVSNKAASEVTDLDSTSEKAVADWLQENIDVSKGERVFIPGNYGFYLNWFTDIWQHRGGLFQAATHYWPDHIHYQLAVGDDEEIALAWLKAMNAKYAVITATGSTELYKEIKSLERFGNLPVEHKIGGDIFYRVPLERPSLVKPVSRVEMEMLEVIEKADHKKPLLAYVDWLEESSLNEADFNVVDHDTYKISGKLDQGESLLIQMTADSGWRASDSNSGRRVKTGKDPLGFLVLYPEAGDFEIMLQHVSTWKIWLGYLTTVMTVGFIIWYGVMRRGQ